MVFEAPQLDSQEIEVLAKISELSAALRLRLLESRGWSDSLSRVQFARAVKASSAIDGVTSALDDTTAIDLGEFPIDADETTRFALKGHRDALTYVDQLASDGDFDYSTQLLKGLHFIMGSYDSKCRPGRWREGPSTVRNRNADVTIYMGPSAREVPALMADLVGALQSTDGPPAIVRAAMAHLNLAMIRPFQNGNGRLGRSLQTLVFARQGVLSATYVSVDEYLGRNVVDYHNALAQVGGETWQPDRSARPWVRFMLTAHLRQAQTMKRRASESEHLWERLEELLSSRGLPVRTAAALYDASMGFRVRSATYRAALDDSSDDAITEATASRDLRQLAESGLFEPVGEKRGRHYVATVELLGHRQLVVSSRKKKDKSDPFSKQNQRD